jgi:hypothetical protein
VPWGELRPDLQRCRLRWLARAQALVGRAAEARELRARLREREDEGPIESLLARIDEALEQEADVEPPFQALLRTGEREPVLRLVRGVEPVREQARLVAREYPY